MKLSDIMSSVDLTLFPKVALILFLAAFAALTIRTFARYSGGRDAIAASLPLEDGITASKARAQG